MITIDDFNFKRIKEIVQLLEKDIDPSAANEVSELKSIVENLEKSKETYPWGPLTKEVIEGLHLPNPDKPFKFKYKLSQKTKDTFLERLKNRFGLQK